ncbi:hypothetical protein ACFC06_10590 [Nocardia sp. NPDC056064]|uniref:hypothetical protein n=1 Tax=Nocardia sp. NPDC056064 TaxID=3345701 RepID=UPI0035D67F46
MLRTTVVAGGTAVVTGVILSTQWWAAAAYFSAVTVVTILALCRANRDDVPWIFEAWVAGFGFRGPAQRSMADVDELRSAGRRA